MEVNPGYWHGRENGAIEVEAIPPQEWDISNAELPIVRVMRYRWTPPYHLAWHLPENITLPFRCWVDGEGNRRFFPDRPIFNYISEAVLVGHAILADRDEIDLDELLFYDEAWLFFQYAQHRREYLRRRTSLRKTLGIARAGSPDGTTRDILPDDLGLDVQGRGERWTLSRFREEGIQAARAAGKENANQDEVLIYGLLEGAQRNPLLDAGDRIENLMRMALFALSEGSGSLDADDIRYVARQVQASLADHRFDTTEQFTAWLEDRRSNLLHRIAKRRDCPINRDQVKAALLVLAFRSFKIVGRCIHASMHAFREAIQQPLNETENALFKQMYLANPSLGNMPLVLLRERFDFIQQIVLRMWDRPEDPELAAILHRMLAYFAEMIEKRREGDRHHKRRSQARNQQGQVASEASLFEETACVVTDENTTFEFAALRLARRHGFRSEIEGAEWNAWIESEDEAEEEVVIRLVCPDHGVDEVFRTHRLELTIAAREVEADCNGSP